MSNEYWDGSTQASLTREQIDADWGRPGVPYSGTSIAMVNRAFEFYYTACQRIAGCENVAQTRRMTEALHDAGRSGWGMGVDDLEEAFEHLVSNNGRWTNNATWNYYGGPNKIFQGAAIVTGPTSIVNFLNAVDDGMSQLRETMQNYQRQVRDLNAAQDAGNWESVGTLLGEVKTWGERAEPFLWMSPTVQERVGQVVAFADVLGNIHSGLTVYAQSRGAGFDERTSAALGALRTALGWVPVLGDFYGRAVEMIPGLATWFRGLMEDYTRRIDRAASGA